ncbi:PREDICTED: ATP-dependent DNA helicase PIF1 [Crocodylus porosus]|uniref:ATP-dependent DNA helicase PIF1 n=1 Tax=Crocodylus porosus TaxID=8502 RepID=UPI00093913B7|nr:PREDICTED: ATP-dependent DNA helicase PIF1 [Crocodylus porosus]
MSDFAGSQISPGGFRLFSIGCRVKHPGVDWLSPTPAFLNPRVGLLQSPGPMEPDPDADPDPCCSLRCRAAVEHEAGAGRRRTIRDACVALARNELRELVLELRGAVGAGTGKSYLLKKILGSLPPKSTYATASTGVAACHIGGTTLHAFAGIGSGKAPLEQCIQLARRLGVRQHWLDCQHLIIDEISMVDGEFFDKLEAVARAVRKRDDPFGGIQLIICGDFLQLPPVCKGNNQIKFCFQAKSWRKCICVNMELTEVRRQTDKTFISLLRAVRLGRCPDEVTWQLTQTAANRVEKDGILATRLCTHKDDVELTNERRLQQLPGERRSFEAVDSDPMLAKLIDAQCPVGHRIELKPGAQVMLTKNLDVSRGLVNGARGVVVEFEAGGKGLPRVRFLCGVTEVIKLERWIFKGPSGVHLSRQQLPLKLAWAISIHKSQGMSLDCVEISLSRVFESGQAYVALSRARSLKGLRVLDFDPKVVKANPQVLEFYSQLRRDQILMQAPLHGYADTNEKENWESS